VLPGLLRRLPEVLVVVLGFGLNAAWEFLQSPLYADHARGPVYVLWTRLHCTAGDVLILLGAFWLTSLILRGRQWWRVARVGPGLLFTLLGMVYTICSEWFNTEVRGSWEYAAAMPLVLGIGLAPLLQWALLPPCILALMRRFAPEAAQ
jgi:hypothetical protein